MAAITALYAPDFVLNDPLTPGVCGPEGYQHDVMAMRIPFPDLQFTAAEQLAENWLESSRNESRGLS